MNNKYPSAKTGEFIRWFEEEWNRITKKLNQYDLSRVKLVGVEGK